MGDVASYLKVSYEKAAPYLKSVDKDEKIFIKAASDVDGNGKINEKDANLILKYSVRSATLKYPGLADVDQNGTVDASDARIVSRISSGYKYLKIFDQTKGDGKLDEYDFFTLYKTFEGIFSPSPSQKDAVDINRDGKVDDDDLRILHYEKGISFDIDF